MGQFSRERGNCELLEATHTASRGWVHQLGRGDGGGAPAVSTAILRVYRHVCMYLWKPNLVAIVSY